MYNFFNLKLGVGIFTYFQVVTESIYLINFFLILTLISYGWCIIRRQLSNIEVILFYYF
jgi:hypothetical protein